MSKLNQVPISLNKDGPTCQKKFKNGDPPMVWEVDRFSRNFSHNLF